MIEPQDDPLPPPTKTPPPATEGLTFVESAKSQRIQRTSYDNPKKDKPKTRKGKRGKDAR